MTDENAKFVEEMLKRAEKKEETKPQKRFEGVDQKEIEKMAENVQKGRKAHEEE